MSRRFFPCSLWALFGLTFGCLILTRAACAAETVAESPAAWPVPSETVLRDTLSGWLHKENVTTPELREKILARWSEGEAEVSPGGKALFEKTVASMREASPAVADYLDACDRTAWQELPFGQTLQVPQLPLQAHLGEGEASNYLVGALRYYLAQRLVQARFYDEAVKILNELKPGAVIEPTGVLLNRAVVCNHLSQPEPGLEAIKAFRTAAEGDVTVPRRYLELAKLLEFDLENSKKEQDPQNIARKMNNVRRRLAKGQTDEDTQQAETDVMKSLDELIEKVESQCQKPGDGDGEGNPQPNKPAEDSRARKLKGPGNVDRREFDPGDNWGDLPPKEREEALLKIEKEFPPHYRDIIEQYFREMAAQGGQ